MKPSIKANPRSLRTVRPLVWIMIAALGFASFLACSPSLHAKLHGHIENAFHQCAATLLQSGAYDAATGQENAPDFVFGSGEKVTLYGGAVVVPAACALDPARAPPDRVASQPLLA